jgi:hypothetical protein
MASALGDLMVKFADISQKQKHRQGREGPTLVLGDWNP